MEGKSPAACQNKIDKDEIKKFGANKSPSPNMKLKSGDNKQAQSGFGAGNANSCKNTSRIPKREESTLSSRNLRCSTGDKKCLLRKRSKTSIDNVPIKAKPSSTSKPSLNKEPSSATIGSFTHRAGQLPSYLKKGDRNVTETTLNTKKRTLNAQKKKLEDLQTDFLTNFKNLHEMQCKFNKAHGKEIESEEVKLVAILNGKTGELLIKDDGKSLSGFDKKFIPAVTGGVGEGEGGGGGGGGGGGDDDDMERIRSKILYAFDSSYKLCQELIDTFSLIPEGQEVRAGDSKNVCFQITSILKDMEGRIMHERDEQKKQLATIIYQLQNSTSFKNMKDTSSENAEQLKDPKDEEINKLKELLEEHKKLLDSSELRLKEIENAESVALKNVKNQLIEKETKISEMSGNLLQLSNDIKVLEDQYRAAEQNSIKYSKELFAKDATLKKLERDLEELKKCTSKTAEGATDVKRQMEAILELRRKEEEARRLYEKEHILRTKLEQDLMEKEKVPTTDNKNASTPSDRISQDVEKEIYALRVAVERFKKEKTILEKEKEDLQKALMTANKDHSKSELSKVTKELNDLKTTNDYLRDNITKLESTVSKKVSIINELEKKIANSQYFASGSKELQNEINSLRESEVEKKRKIELLKSELSKAHVEIKQQEETICMHQRLLRIRSELINSLQEKEASNRFRMDDLYSEIHKKSSLVSKMNSEISAKAEELQNLFSTLGTKQLEVNRQEHIIKMLEENNERSQKLRVKQEEKIARLESENAELKRMIKRSDLKTSTHKN